MERTVITSLSAEEFKSLLKEVLIELLKDQGLASLKEKLPDLMDIRQASEFVRLKITTLYEKTSKRLIPHIKRGGKLYFERTKLENWLKSGEVSTEEDLSQKADEFFLKRKKH